MILGVLMNAVITVFAAVFVALGLPVVDKLPSIGGFDIDSALTTGMGEFYAYADAFWFIRDVFYGFLALMFYYIIKMGLKLLLGNRAPGH